MPYFTSAQVTGRPSCQAAPARSTNDHVRPPSRVVPVSRARSGTRVRCWSGVVPGANVVSVLLNRRLATDMSEEL